MICIDCSIDKTATIVQYRVVFGRTCHWHICRECLAAYDAVTAQIKREQAAKALGKTPAPVKRPTATTQRSLV